ncbi:hypothetical protein F5Y19DRAFT_475866 [Xylariaceae sp. FL1651]|nr:hypothetical protein F5Y19DRAFT_475866 [Xylariaceae sp. FL1651]
MDPSIDHEVTFLPYAVDNDKPNLLSSEDASTSSGHRPQLMAARRGGKRGEHEGPGTPSPLTYPISPMAMIEHNAMCVKQDGVAAAKHSPDQPRVLATFIVSGHPEAVPGVIKAVYHDLKDANKDAAIELQQTASASYIRVDVPTYQDALALMHAAQRQATAYISGHSDNVRIIFVEPPSHKTASDLRVVVHVDAESERVCYRLETSPGTLAEFAPSDRLDMYTRDVSEALYEALERCGSLYSWLTLRVHLGQYIFDSYKTGRFTLKDFEAMVKHPRATGRLNTYLGGTPTANGMTPEGTIHLIRAAGSPFVPMDTQTPATAQVAPIYILETCTDDVRFETSLELMNKIKSSTKGPVKFKLLRTKVFPEHSQAPGLSITSISLSKKLDWTFEAIPKNQKGKKSTAVQRYFETAEAVMQGSYSDFHAYPTVRLNHQHGLAKKFKSIAIKSVYQFSWKGTEYVVEYTINRRWHGIREMAEHAPPDVDFGLAIYGEHWDQDSRVAAGETVGKIWGSDLRGLLRDEAGDETGSAVSRIRGFLKTIQDIRDFFENTGRAS